MISPGCERGFRRRSIWVTCWFIRSVWREREIRWRMWMCVLTFWTALTFYCFSYFSLASYEFNFCMPLVFGGDDICMRGKEKKSFQSYCSVELWYNIDLQYWNTQWTMLLHWSSWVFQDLMDSRALKKIVGETTGTKKECESVCFR